jgi:signal-transduction protein with cAMP-binding, CBS, and nucleotidyltransferase domain
VKSEFIKAIPVFKGLADEELTILVDSFALNQYANDAKLFKAGEPSDALYVVENGFLRLQSPAVSSQLVSIPNMVACACPVTTNWSTP